MKKSVVFGLLLAAALGFIQKGRAQDSLNFSKVGELSFWGEIGDVVVSGNYAYISDITFGLRIIDITNPAVPTEIGFCDVQHAVEALAVQGSYAYLAVYYFGMIIIDVSDPANPIQISTCPFPPGSDAADIAVQGAFAYVADYYNYLRIIDISDPLDPQIVGSYYTPYQPISISIHDTYAYMCSYMFGEACFTVIDVANPVNPTLLGNCNLNFEAYSVVDGTYAYLAEGSLGLRVIDVSNPSSPITVATCNTLGWSQGIAVSGSYAYIAGGSEGGLQIIDITNPLSPVIVGSLITQGNARSLDKSTSYVCIAAGNQGLRVIDVAQISSPREVGFCCRPGNAYDIALSGSFAYFLEGPWFNGLGILDISNPTNPVIVGGIHLYGNALHIVESCLYVALEGGGLRILDISNPLNPTALGAATNIGEIYGLDVAGSYAYAAGSQGLKIINILNPYHPVLISSINIQSTRVAVAGSFAYLIGYGNAFRIIDVSSPSNPVVVSWIVYPGEERDVAVEGDFAYLATVDPAGLRIVNVSNPAVPVEVGFCAIPGYNNDVNVVGNYAYIADGFRGIFAVDVINPANPIITGYYCTNSTYSANSCAIAGDFVYLAASDYFDIFTVSQFSIPDLTVILTPLSPPITIPATGGSFNFNASAQRTVGPQAPFAVWARIKNPDGTYTPPTLGPVTINTPVGITITRQRTQTVPGTWAAGVYTYLGYVNTTYAYPAVDSSSFTFTKSVTTDGGPWITEASCTGEPFPGEQSPPLLRGGGGDLIAIQPNPFNAITVARFELRVPSQVSLRIYDTAGRLVTTLVEGWREAGTHSATFDGSMLASGIYLARLEVGEFRSVQKLVLMK